MKNILNITIDKKMIQEKYDSMTKKQREVIFDNTLDIQIKLFKIITPQHSVEQIEQIIFGLEEGIDVTLYSDPANTIDYMKKKRIDLIIKSGIPGYERQPLIKMNNFKKKAV